MKCLVLLFGVVALLFEAMATTTPTVDLIRLTDTLLYNVTMSDFVTYRSLCMGYTTPTPAQLPGVRRLQQLVWISDGCTGAPDTPSHWNFKHACERHDFGYRNYRDQSRLDHCGRKKIDQNFKKDMLLECKKHSAVSEFGCRLAASSYYSTVRLFGRGHQAKKAMSARMADDMAFVGGMLAAQGGTFDAHEIDFDGVEKALRRKWKAERVAGRR